MIAYDDSFHVDIPNLVPRVRDSDVLAYDDVLHVAVHDDKPNTAVNVQSFVANDNVFYVNVSNAMDRGHKFLGVLFVYGFKHGLTNSI